MDWTSNAIIADGESEDKLNGLPASIEDLAAKPSSEANSTDGNEGLLIESLTSNTKLESKANLDNGNSNASSERENELNNSGTPSANANEFSMVNFDANDSNEGNLLDFSNHDLPHLSLNDPSEMSSLVNQEDNSDNREQADTVANAANQGAAESIEPNKLPEDANANVNDDLVDEEIKKVSMIEQTLDKIVPNENESAVLMPSTNLDDYNFAIPISSSPVNLNEIIVLNAENTRPMPLNEARPIEPSTSYETAIDESMLTAFPTTSAQVTSKPKSSLDESIDSCIEKCMKSLTSNRFNFKCQQCAYSTKFKVHIIEHMLNAHDIYVMQCPEPNCNKKFKDEWKLKRHLVSNREHPPLENYKSLNDVLRRHIDISLQKTGFPCPLCQIDQTTGQLVETDAQNNDVVDNNKLLINEKHENNFLYLDEYEKLVEHMTKQHPSFNMDAYFICKQCGQVFLSKYKLSCHLFNVHSGKRKNRSRLDGGPSKKRGAIYDPVMESIIATTNRYLYPNESSKKLSHNMSNDASDFHLDDVIDTVASGQIFQTAASKSVLNPKYKFFCEICNRYFKRERDIFTHTKIMHKQINIEQVKFVNIQKSGAHGSGAGVSWRGDGGASSRKCHVCNKVFKEIPGKGIANNSLIRKSFIRHMQTQHGLNENGERLIECPVCEKNFFNKQQLERHMHTHEIWIEARADDEDSENKINLVNHNNEFNDINSAIEDVVNSFSATGANDLNNPDSSNDNSKFNMPDYKESHSILYCHECVECKQFYKSIKVLTKHKKEVHKLRPVYRCANLVECNAEFEKVNEFLDHALIHPQRNIFCSRCKETFTNKNLLRHHMKNVHYSRKYAAGRSLSKAKSILLSSSKLSPAMDDGGLSKHHYSCHTCQKNFSSKNSLHNHLATHSDVRLFLCDVCSHAFKTRKDLSRHAALHDSSKHKRCEKCGMTFKTSFHLKRHSLTRHSNIRPFTCDICEMTFARKDKLKQHEAKHVNHPLFKCSQCEKGFYRKEHLKDHEISKHSKQYPFICEHCSKGFVHAKDLHRHIRVRHLGVAVSNLTSSSAPQTSENTITAKIIHMPTNQVITNPQILQANQPKPRGRAKKNQQTNLVGTAQLVHTMASTPNVQVNDFKSKKISSILKTQMYQNQVASNAAQIHPVFQTTANIASLSFNNSSQPLQLLPIGTQTLNSQHQQQRILSNILPIGTLQDFNASANSSNQPKMAQILTPMNLSNLQPIGNIDMRNNKAAETKPGAKEKKRAGKNAANQQQQVVMLTASNQGASGLTVMPGIQSMQQTMIQSVQNTAQQNQSTKGPKNGPKSANQAGAGKRANKNKSSNVVNNTSSIGINLNDISNNVIINNNNINSANFFSAPSFKCERCQLDFQNETLLSKHIKSKHPPAQTYSCSYCHKSFSNKPAAKAHIDNNHARYKCPLCSEAFTTRNYINRHFSSKHSSEEEKLKPIKEMIVEAHLVEMPVVSEKETLKTFTIEASSNANKNTNVLSSNNNMNNMKNFMQLPPQMLNQSLINSNNHLTALPTFNTGNQNFQQQMQINPALLNQSNAENLINANATNNGLIHANQNNSMLINNFNNKLLQNTNNYISHSSNIIDMNQPIHTSNIWPQASLNNSGANHKINQLQNGPFGTIIAHDNNLNSNSNLFVQSQLQKQAQQMQQGNTNAANTQFYLTNLPIQMTNSGSSSTNMQMSNQASLSQSGAMQSGQDSHHIQIHILSGANDNATGGGSSGNTMSTNLITSNMGSSTASLNDIIASNSSKY